MTTAEALSGPLSPANLPLQAAGFRAGYRVGAPCEVRFSDGEKGIVYVFNTIYQFEDQAQAAAAFEGQIAFYEKSGVPQEVSIVALRYDSSLACRAGVQGRAYAVRYASDGSYWESRYFIGIRADTLLFLMVDGLPDPATERVFDILAAKLIQRQDW